MWTPSACDISALAWSNNSNTPSLVKANLTIAHDSGSLMIYDMREREILAKIFLKRDKIVVIKWSPFIKNEFYIGSSTGLFAICEFIEDETPKIEVKAKLRFSFPIEFIALDAQTGTTVSIASKTGHLVVFQDIKEVKTGDNTIKSFHILGNNDVGTGLFFFPSHPNFIIFTSTNTSTIFAINESVSLPFLDHQGIRFIHNSLPNNNQIAIGYDGYLELWEYRKKEWVHLSTSTLTTVKSGKPEAKHYLTLDTEIMVITESGWITILQPLKDRLFITHRIALFASAPLAFDALDGILAFSTTKGSLYITEPPKRARRKSSFSKPGGLHASIPHLHGYYTFEHASTAESGRRRRYSVSDAHKKKQEEENDFSTASNKPLAKKYDDENGCSMAFQYQFKISPNQRFDHIQWVNREQLIAWVTEPVSHMYFIDIKARKITPIMEHQLTSIHVSLTNVYARNKVIIILLEQHIVIFMAIKDDGTPEKFGATTFKDPTICCLSPSANRMAFVSHGGIISFVIFDSKRIKGESRQVFSKMKGEPTFAKWVDTGILLATSSGYVYSINPETHKIRKVLSIQEPIKYVSPAGDNSHFIVTKSNNGIVIEEGTEKPLKHPLKSFKQASCSILILRYKGTGTITTFSFIKGFRPQRPAFILSHPILQPDETWKKDLSKLKIETPDEAIEACREYGAIFLQALIKARLNPTKLQEHTDVLLGIISNCKEFHTRVFRVAIMSDHRDLAHNLIVGTSPDSPEFMTSMFKALLFHVISYDEKVNETVDLMVKSGQIEEAIEAYLILKDIRRAYQLYIDSGNNRDAAMLLSMQRKCEGWIGMAKEVSKRLIEEGNTLMGLLLLSDSEKHEELMQIITNVIDDSMAHFLNWLDSAKCDTV